MHLDFAVPDGWTAQRSGNVVTVQRGAFGSRIDGVLVPKGTDPRSFLEADRPPGSRVEYLQILDDLQAKAGWRMKLVTLEVRDATARVLETRIAAVIEMTHFLGVAVGHLRVDTDRAALLDILASAQPHLWPDEVVCIAELWSMEAP